MTPGLDFPARLHRRLRGASCPLPSLPAAARGGAVKSRRLQAILFRADCRRRRQSPRGHFKMGHRKNRIGRLAVRLLTMGFCCVSLQRPFDCSCTTAAKDQILKNHGTDSGRAVPWFFTSWSAVQPGPASLFAGVGGSRHLTDPGRRHILNKVNYIKRMGSPWNGPT